MPTSRKSSVSSVITVVLVVLALVIGLAAVVFGFVVRHEMAAGERGTFTPQTQTCKRESRRDAEGHRYYEVTCSWDGRFEGADTTIDDVHIDNSLGTEQGDPAPAPVDAVLGSHGGVFLDRTSSWLGRVVAGGAVFVAGLVGGVVVLRRRSRDRREEARHDDAPVSITW